MRISIPQPNYPSRAQVGETVYYRSPVNRYAVKRSVVVEIRLNTREQHYEQVMRNGDIVLKDPRMIDDFSTFPTREIAIGHIMATLIENINSRQTIIDSLFHEQHKEQRTVLEIKDMVGEREFEIKGFHDIRQRLCLVNGVHYDVIECKIDVKWKDNGNISTYDEECWFNITQLESNELK